MKRPTLKTKLATLLFLSFALLLSGCGSEKTVSNDKSGEVGPSQPAGPYVPPGTSSGGGSLGEAFDYGANAPIILDGATDTQKNQTMGAYVGVPRYNISQLTLNLNLVKRADGFGGRIAIGYYDEDAKTFRRGVFVNGDEQQFWNTSLDDAAKYNVWFQKDGDLYFHGFFQDTQGGVIIVIEDFVSLGDGQPPTHVKGSIWFKNFQIYSDPYTLMPPHPPTHCWLVSIGPYDCRSWKSGKTVDTTSEVLPTDGYQKLGEFQGLELAPAFNGEDLGI